MNVYIAKETLSPNFPEDVAGLVDRMTEILEGQGHEVSVGDLWKQQEEEASDAVTQAWEKACSEL